MGRGRRSGAVGAVRSQALEAAGSAEASGGPVAAATGEPRKEIRVTARQFNAEQANPRIRPLLLEHRGQTPVVLVCDEQTMRCPSVTWSAELVAELRQLLGLEKPTASAPAATASAAPAPAGTGVTAAPARAAGAPGPGEPEMPGTRAQLRARLMRQPGNPHPELPVLGWLLPPDVKLTATELAVADLFEEGSMGGRDQEVRLVDLWRALYRHWEDTKTGGDIYVQEGARWRRLIGREGFAESADLPEEIKHHRLQQVNPTSKYADRINPPPGTPPRSPDSLRRNVIESLRAKGLPILSSIDPTDPGYRIAHTRAEMEREQASRRQALETELHRLDAQLEMASRFERALATGEVAELGVEYDAGSGRGPEHHRAVAQGYAPREGKRESKRGHGRPRKSQSATPELSWGEVIS